MSKIMSIVWGSVPREILSYHGQYMGWKDDDRPYLYSKRHGMDGNSHPGVDVRMPNFTSIYAVDAGKVVRIRQQDDPREKEIVVLSRGNEHLYTHLYGTDVIVGQDIETGQLLGKSGADHLHFECRIPSPHTLSGWLIVDPIPLLTEGYDVALPTAQWRPLIAAACQYAGTIPTLSSPPEDVFEAMVLTESEGDPNARSKSGAIGLAQIIPKWHGDLIQNVSDDLSMTFSSAENAVHEPIVGLYAGARLLAWNYTECGTWETAVAKYHSGKCNPPNDFTDGQGTTTVKHLAKYREALVKVRADRNDATPGDGTGGAIPEEPVAGYTKHTWPGLDVPVYLPDWIEVEIKIIPSSVSGWTSGTKSSRHVKTTWHDTGNPNSNQDSEYTWARNGGRGEMKSPGSYNGIFGGKKVIITQRFDEMVGHAANDTGNYTSYAFEQTFGPGSGGFEESLKVGTFLHGGVIAAKGWNVDDALRQHFNWSGKNCPGQIRNKGRWAQVVSMTKDAATKAEAAAVGGTIPTPKPEPVPTLNFPEGMDLEIAEALFGRVEGDDKVMYSFDPTGKGVISKAWLERGKREKKFPTLARVRIFEDARYFIFSDGTVLWHPKVTDPVRVLGE